jgi:hypothetical protein
VIFANYAECFRRQSNYNYKFKYLLSKYIKKVAMIAFLMRRCRMSKQGLSIHPFFMRFESGNTILLNREYSSLIEHKELNKTLEWRQWACRMLSRPGFRQNQWTGPLVEQKDKNLNHSSCPLMLASMTLLYQAVSRDTPSHCSSHLWQRSTTEERQIAHNKEISAANKL